MVIFYLSSILVNFCKKFFLGQSLILVLFRLASSICSESLLPDSEQMEVNPSARVSFLKITGIRQTGSISSE
jgi:hypothetical protein